MQTVADLKHHNDSFVLPDSTHFHARVCKIRSLQLLPLTTRPKQCVYLCIYLSQRSTLCATALATKALSPGNGFLQTYHNLNSNGQIIAVAEGILFEWMGRRRATERANLTYFWLSGERSGASTTANIRERKEKFWAVVWLRIARKKKQMQCLPWGWLWKKNKTQIRSRGRELYKIFVDLRIRL